MGGAHGGGGHERGRYEGELTIWCDPSVREGLCQMARITLQKKMTDRLGDRILFHDISDGQTDTILGRKVRFSIFTPPR